MGIKGLLALNLRWLFLRLCQFKCYLKPGLSFNGAQEKTDDNIPMPNYFRFLALLAFKIFAAEQVYSPCFKFIWNCLLDIY
jgi:hypothetical protein